MSPDRWHLITGEYPPAPGGVADYSAGVAAALAGCGAEVHVWTAGAPEGEADCGGVSVHRPIGRWSPGELARLDDALDAFAPPRRLLVQYVPGTWGYKGLNLAFCRWLVRRRARGDDVRVMFHEVWYTLQPGDSPRRWLLRLGQQWMARTVMDACGSAYVSIPAWEPLLRASERRGRRPVPVTWLPIPSNIPVVADAGAVADLRRKVAPGGETVVGSFGTFGESIGDLLFETLPRVLGGRVDRVGLLIGRGSDRFAARLVAGHPELAGRLHAAAALPPDAVSLHVQACDLLVQPYPDGLTSRRTTLMAGLAHGVATVSNLGEFSEPAWERTGGVVLAPGPDPAALARAAEPLLASPETRAELGMLAREVYRRHFAIERTVEVLTGSGVVGSGVRTEVSAPTNGVGRSPARPPFSSRNPGFEPGTGTEGIR